MIQRMLDIEKVIARIEQFRKLNVSELDQAIDIYQATARHCEEQAKQRMREINAVNSSQL